MEPSEHDARGVYGISVAAESVGLTPQNLRQYEQRGLLTPARTPGGTRLYSERDLAVLRRIRQLLEEGLNLAGIGHVLRLEDSNRRLEETVEDLRSDR